MIVDKDVDLPILLGEAHNKDHLSNEGEQSQGRNRLKERNNACF